MIKRSFKILIPMCFFLLPISKGVHAAGIKDTISTNPFKTWTIKFNQKIDFYSLTKNSISVLDSNGDIVPVTLSLCKDNKSILVTPPSTGYNIGEIYTLNINSNVHSEKNKHLIKSRTINFNITKELTDKEIRDILKNAEDNTIKMCYSRNYDKLYADEKTYLPFKEEFNSEKKVYDFLRNYYTDRMSKAMMSYLGTRYVDGRYAELSGDWGESTNWNSITIINKNYLDSNTIEFTLDFFDKNNYSIDYTNNSDVKYKPNPKHHYSNYKLKYENNKWLIDYDSNFN